MHIHIYTHKDVCKHPQDYCAELLPVYKVETIGDACYANNLYILIIAILYNVLI